MRMRKKKSKYCFKVKILSLLMVLLMHVCCFYCYGAAGKTEESFCPADEVNSAEVFAVSEEIRYTSPVYTNGEIAKEPPDILEQAGKWYRLISKKLKSAEKEGILTYVSTRIPYELEGNTEPPSSAIVTLNSPENGSNYERELNRLEVEEKTEEWVDDFFFQITVEQYDADTFFLDDVEIPKDADFLEYQEAFLDHLGLPQDCYRISRVEWDGETYEKDGIVYRDAVAYGDKKIRHVEVLYGGQIRTPNVPGKQYEAVYREIVLEMETKPADMVEETTEAKKQEAILYESETEPIVLQEKAKSPGERLMQWVKEHVTVTMISGTFILGLIGWIGLLLSKKERDRKAGD